MFEVGDEVKVDGLPWDIFEIVLVSPMIQFGIPGYCKLENLSTGEVSDFSSELIYFPKEAAQP